MEYKRNAVNWQLINRFVVLILTCFFTVRLGTILVQAESTTIAVTKTALSINIDANDGVYLTSGSSNAVSWESTNTGVATIESSTTRKAVIVGVGKGTTDIIATDQNGNRAICKVTVLAPVFSVTSQIKMAVEEEQYVYVEEGEAVTWKSSNNDIVSITYESPSNAMIKGEGVGTAVITAIDKYGTETKCLVTVRQENFAITINPVSYADYYSDGAIDFSKYWFQNHIEGWWDQDYNYHESYEQTETLQYYDIYAYEGSISKCTSANSNVVSVVKTDYGYRVFPKGVGSTVITVIDPYGEKETIKCNVTWNYFLEKEGNDPWEDNYSPKKYYYNNLKYGSGKLTGVTYSNAKITATINGKTYSSNANSSGSYSINVPKYIKVNTPIIIKTTGYGVTKTYTRKVNNNNPGIKISSAKKGTKVVKLVLKNVHKGDYVKLKVGKKTYTKKIKKDKKQITLKIKTKKLKKGQKITARIFNVFKQKMNTKSKKVK